MKDRDGRIVAVDFGGYSFLPHSFFAFALQHGGPSRLKQHLIRILRYPRSSTVSAMVGASCALAPYSSNNVGEQISFSFSCLSPPCGNTEFNVLRRSSEGAPVQASSVNAAHKPYPVQQVCVLHSRRLCTHCCDLPILPRDAAVHIFALSYPTSEKLTPVLADFGHHERGKFILDIVTQSWLRDCSDLPTIGKVHRQHVYFQFPVTGQPSSDKPLCDEICSRA